MATSKDYKEVISEPEFPELEAMSSMQEIKALIQPLRKKNKVANPGEEDGSIEDTDPENRLKELHWCKCEECQIMKSVNDCLCCTEIYALENMLTPEITCISKHSSFNDV